MWAVISVCGQLMDMTTRQSVIVCISNDFKMGTCLATVVIKHGRANEN